MNESFLGKTMICFQYVTLEELTNKLFALMKAEKESSNQNATKQRGTLLSRKDAAAFLHISLPTLNAWTKENKLVAHRINSRVYYKQEELLTSLKKITY